MQNNYQPVIGLELHLELRTKSKVFCSCLADHFGKSPNAQVCPVCLGLPGAMPVPNKTAIEWTLRLGAAFGCELNKTSQFDRKHYFYPDLPKGYQISQYEHPLVGRGEWELVTGQRIGIRRIHLEEDTGKLIHRVVDGKRVSLIDYNRSGVPLVELVTEPDFKSAKEAKEFLQEVQLLIRYLEISDADMEKGSMRLEANISVLALQEDSLERADIPKLPDYRVEVKNINSFRFLEKAIEYEIKRQTEVLVSGENLKQETRGFDEASGTTRLQRSKEEAQDYRYFPEPDIPRLVFTDKELEEIKSDLPELPQVKGGRFVTEYGIDGHYAQILTQKRDLADYFEESIKIGLDHGITVKKIADTIINKRIDIEKTLPAQLIKHLKGDSDKKLISGEKLKDVVIEVLQENQGPAQNYKNGKEGALQFLIGIVMSKTKGLASPQETLDMLRKELDD